MSNRSAHPLDAECAQTIMLAGFLVFDSTGILKLSLFLIK